MKLTENRFYLGKENKTHYNVCNWNAPALESVLWAEKVLSEPLLLGLSVWDPLHKALWQMGTSPLTCACPPQESTASGVFLFTLLLDLRLDVSLLSLTHLQWEGWRFICPRRTDLVITGFYWDVGVLEQNSLRLKILARFPVSWMKGLWHHEQFKHRYFLLQVEGNRGHNISSLSIENH